ncbi:MAG: GLPGLI family protein [Bacteroidia bacterium]|jgi:GLPGLI family protein|nr:GLPGLI family protein [Bacteroidia bacterium]
MNKSFILAGFGLFIAGTSLVGQITSGTISYTRTVKVKFQGPPQFQPPGGGGEHIINQKLELLFSGQQMLLRNVQESTNDTPEEEGAVVVRVMGASDNNEVFTDLTTRKKSSLRELGKDVYVVDDTLTDENWQLSTETKSLLGHTCRKATRQEIRWVKQMQFINDEMKLDSILDTIPIVAWYAEGFGLNGGPEATGVLKGMILEYDVDNGRIHCVATEISKEVKTKEIKMPKGKHITAAQYKILEADFRRKMMQNRGMRMPPPR